MNLMAMPTRLLGIRSKRTLSFSAECVRIFIQAFMPLSGTTHHPCGCTEFPSSIFREPFQSQQPRVIFVLVPAAPADDALQQHQFAFGVSLQTE